MATALQQALLAQPPAAADQRALPAWFVEHRRRARAAMAAAPWPQRRDEAWKYTSLHALAQQAPRLAAPVAPNATTEAALAFVDGHGTVGDAPDWMRRLADVLVQAPDDVRAALAGSGRDDDPAATADVFDLANAAFAGDGTWIEVPPGVVDDRVHRIAMQATSGDEPRHWHLLHRVVVGEGASVQLHFDLEFAGAAAASLATLATRIRVRRGGRLRLSWTAVASACATLARTHVQLEADAILDLHVFDAGAAPSRHNLRIDLDGSGAQARLGGVFLLDERRHADLQLDLRHLAPDASSRTTWRALADGRSRGVFNGRIAVAPGADGTDARLGCKSLLGSALAEVDVKPELEILADDVQCAHGATVGQLDAQALFYLRSRGLPEAQARALLMRAFAAEALADAPLSPAALRLQQALAVRP